MHFRRRVIFGAGATLLAAAAALLARLGPALGGNHPPDPAVAAAAPAPAPAEPVLHPVTIRQPTAPRVATGQTSPSGEPVTVSCATCHDPRPPAPATASGAELDEFHQGLDYRHGSLTCLSCHHPKNYDSLRLADGRALPYARSMELCAQCHGPQFRDYRHGSHGGMTGYWDLRQGPRQRNHCLDCHDPHAPAPPQVLPVFPPRDTRGR